MGFDAQVIAIGPYSTEVASALEYGPEFYQGISVGITVITNVFVAGTSEVSQKLAEAFGVQAMELGNHMLAASKADTYILAALFGEVEVEKFLLLARHGFNFYYLPNA